MRLLLHLVIEIVLAIVILFAGNMFWELRRRAKFVRRAISSQQFLDSFVSRDALANPSQQSAPYIQKNEVGWFLNIKILMDADKASQQKPSVFFALILGGILVASYFLGMAYLIVNLVLFGFSALGSISQSARNNALEHIMTIAIILDRWRSENPSECDEWIKQTWSLGPIYEAVQKAR